MSDRPDLPDRLREVADRLDRDGEGTSSDQKFTKRLAALDHALTGVAGALSAAQRSASREDVIMDVADSYGRDAAMGWRAVRRLYICLGLFLLMLAATLLHGLLSLPSSSSNWAPTIWAHLAIALVILIVSLPVWFQAERYRRSAAESQRMQRQLRLVDSYLEPLDDRARTIMRAALVPRIFPRLLEDQDPMREPLWPPSEVLLPNPDNSL